LKNTKKDLQTYQHGNKMATPSLTLDPDGGTVYLRNNGRGGTLEARGGGFDPRPAAPVGGGGGATGRVERARRKIAARGGWVAASMGEGLGRRTLLEGKEAVAGLGFGWEFDPHNQGVAARSGGRFGRRLPGQNI
jgi:hypothetical protein